MNATSAITATTAITPTQTPALNMVPIASHPDVIAYDNNREDKQDVARRH